jgi:uncharacterized protein
LRLVFDTNVLVSALLLSHSIPRRALDRAVADGKVLLSLPVLEELNRVLAREQIRKYIDEEDARQFLAAMTREAIWVEVSSKVTVCRDPKDNKFLALALDGGATHIVTGDSDLLDLHPFQGIPILTPAAFVALPGAK